MWQLEAGRLALASGEFPEAVPRLVEAIHHFDDGGQQDENARAHLYLATAYHSTGELKAAQTHLEQAFQLAAKLESWHSLVLAGQKARTLLEWMQDAPANGRQASELLRQVAQFEREIPTLRRRLRRGTSAVRSTPPRLTIQALGQAQVMQDGMPIRTPEWQSRKIVRDLFFLLLAHPDGLTKESIGVIFWPDSSPAQLKLRFKNAIYRLRRALGQDVVLFDDDLYRFNRTLDYEYDVKLFLAKLEQARAASDPAEQARAYRGAVHQYGGSYLPELDGTWVLPKREDLRQAYCEAVMKLANYHLQTAEYELALDYCRRVLGEDPCLEEAHRLAMRAHAAGGNRSAVARQFELCRQLLQEEISASPSPQTRALYKTLTR
jgi:DNA-binding SARP family transcriptional activator